MSTENNTWEPCPAGEISHMADRIRGKRVRLMTTRIVSVSACLVAFVVGTAMFTNMGPFASATEKITCAQFKQRLPEYLSDSLAETAVKQVEAHLDHCPNCRHLHDQTKQGDPATSTQQPENRRSGSAVVVALASSGL